jgi:pimeloyl-ACP methyl ester carboxylesterase
MTLSFGSLYLIALCDINPDIMKPMRAFIHGLESTGQGTKGIFFREHYSDMIIEDYFGSFSQRMEKLNSVLAGETPLILVGSSFGGLMAAVYACQNENRVQRLILLAPALHLDLYEPFRNRNLSMPVFIFHGLKDEVVPLSIVKAIAEHAFKNYVFHAVEDDHSLHNTFASMDWDKLLTIP